MPSTSNSPLLTTPLDTIVHLGAGPCTELDDYLASGASTIWLVEADPKVADALTARARAHEQVQVHPLAVAATGGEATLHRYNLPEANSLSPATGLQSLFPGLRLLEQLAVPPPVAYAELLQPFNLQPDSSNHLLVIELPGQELQALQALQQAGTLPAFKHILLHCGREPLHADSTPAETVLQWLEEQGYDLTGQDDDQDPDRSVWTFRRNRHLIELRALRAQFENLTGRLAKSEAQSKGQVSETVTYTRRKPKDRGNAVLDSGLRFDETVPVQVIEQPAPELQGPEADAFEIIGEKITHRLAQRPGAYVILEYHRPVLKRHGTEQLSTTPAPPNVLDRSVADVSFLAGMLIDKFLYHVRHEVARSFIKDLDLMFSHQSPIGPCVGGNPGVRSVRDNVASVFGRVTTPRGSVTTANSKAVGSQGCGAWSTQVNRHFEPPLRTTCQRS